MISNNDTSLIKFEQFLIIHLFIGWMLYEEKGKKKMYERSV